MKEQLVSFDTAKLAKEKGIIFHDIFPFNYAAYTNERKLKNSDAFVAEEKVQDNIPTQSLFQKYLREQHDLIVFPVNFSPNEWNCTVETTSINGYSPETCPYDTYEEALEEGLQEALKLI